MIESYTPIPPRTTTNFIFPPKLYVCFILLASIPLISIILVSIWSEEAHQSLGIYIYLYLLALIVTPLLDYLAIAHIWKADSKEKETGLLLLAWCTHSGLAYQALMKLVGWKLNEEESSLKVVIGGFVGAGLIWMVVGLGGVYGESRQRGEDETTVELTPCRSCRSSASSPRSA